jgi:hypothetical protein
VAEPGDLALRRGRSGPFGITIDKLVRGCAVQGAEFDNWPFDAIARTVNPDENQRKALDALRDAAKQAAQRLAAECPQDVPAAPAARLEAAEQGIAATFAGFDTVEPKLQAFYAALSDEQKARLYRDMATPVAANAGETTGRREAREAIGGALTPPRARVRRARAPPGKPPRPAGKACARSLARCCATGRCVRSSATCGFSASSALPFTSSSPPRRYCCKSLFALVIKISPGCRRDFRVKMWGTASPDDKLTGNLGNVIEAAQNGGRRPDRLLAGKLSPGNFGLLQQYPLKAADTLGSACPADAALTPVGRMELMRKRLAAVRAATAAIRPALARFYEALDQGQKVRFAGMRYATRHCRA